MKRKHEVRKSKRRFRLLPEDNARTEQRVREKLRRRYEQAIGLLGPTAYFELLCLVNRLDPIALMKMAPEDEYSSEVDSAVLELERVRDARAFGRLLRRIFVDSFVGSHVLKVRRGKTYRARLPRSEWLHFDVGPLAGYISVAKAFWPLWQRRREVLHAVNAVEALSGVEVECRWCGRLLLRIVWTGERVRVVMTFTSCPGVIVRDAAVYVRGVSTAPQCLKSTVVGVAALPAEELDNQRTALPSRC